MQNKDSNISPDMSSADCGSSAAEYKVAEVHDDTTDTDLCDAKKYVAYTETSGSRKSRTSVVLCLMPMKSTGWPSSGAGTDSCCIEGRCFT
ncbi:LppU/SCO3897 family protein [Streptomyces sp. NPDC005151]